MKQFILFSFATFFIAACNSKAPVEKEQPAAEVKAIATPVDEKTQKIDALKKLSAADLEAFHRLLPENLDDMKRTTLNSSTTMGYAFAEANYQKGKKNIQVMIYDLAGESGTVWYIDSYSSKLDVSQEDESSYTKTIQMDGKKAIEQMKKDSKYLTLTFLHDDRTLFVVSGRNVSAEELKAFAMKADKQ